MAISHFESAINKHVHRVQTENGLTVTVDLNEQVLTDEEYQQQRVEKLTKRLCEIELKNTDGYKSLNDLIK